MNLDRIRKSSEISEDGCWIWKKSCNSAGYGQLTENKKYWLAHRYAYSCLNPLRDDQLVRHLCHNTWCVNPDHLASGTNQDNWNDSEEVHRKAHEEKRSLWVIDGVEYSGIRNANKNTGISQAALVKYTCPITRIFDVESYRTSTIKAGWKPKI